MRLLALAGLLALALPAAHADLIPGDYLTGINGNIRSGVYGGYITNQFISIPNVGVVPFFAALSPTTASFTVGTQVYGAPNTNFTINSVNFAGNPPTPDYITGFKLEPSSTLTGIVPSTYVNTANGGNKFAPNTYINFDFTGANLLPGSTATFDLTFAPAASAPEIDPSLASSGLVLLAGTMAILRNRRTRPAA